MRELIISKMVSLDGYFTGPDGNVMGLPLDGAFNDYNAERLRAAGTLLLGRTKCEGFKDFWPSVVAHSGAICSPMTWSTSST